MAYKINPITGKMDLVGGNSNSESDSGLSSEEVQELITENLDNPENLVTEDENGINFDNAKEAKENQIAIISL